MSSKPLPAETAVAGEEKDADAAANKGPLGLAHYPADRFVEEADAGLLLGDGVDPFTSGLFRTVDGGKSWQPVGGTRTPAWTSGDFQDGKTGVLAGPMGKLATLRNDSWAYAEPDVFMGRSIGAVRI